MHLRRRLILKRLITLRRIARRLWAYRRKLANSSGGQADSKPIFPEDLS